MQILGYTLEEQLGEGASAFVYRAVELSFNRVVAIKVLSRLRMDPAALRRFRKECEAMGGLSWHPRVVTVYGQGTTEEGFPYLVMEYLPLGSLAARLEGESLSWQSAIRYGVQVADALGAAHQYGLLHRDVKPENVFLDRFGDAKLGDFGIASVTGGTRTATGLVTGTIVHAAPEILGGGRATVASDLYSLGSTLHTLCSGAPPFLHQDDDTIFQLMARASKDPPPDLRTSGVPDDVAAVIECLLSKEPSARFDDAGLVIDTLQQLQSAHGQTPTSTQGRPDIAAAVNHPGYESLGAVDDRVKSSGLPATDITAEVEPFRDDPLRRDQEQVEHEQELATSQPRPLSTRLRVDRRWWPVLGALAIVAIAIGAFTADRNRSSRGERFALPISMSLDTPRAMAVSGNGTIYVADSGQGRLLATSANGDVREIDARVEEAGIGASLLLPTDLAVSGNGTVYVADPGRHRVIAIAEGKASVVAGTGESGYSGDGGRARLAQLSAPYGVAVAGDGAVYVADTGNHVVRRISPDGVIETLVGTGVPGYTGDGGPPGDAQLASPRDVAVSDDGLVVADTGNSVVRSMTGHLIQTVVGTGVQGRGEEGGFGRDVALNQPHSVAVVPDGSTLIADTINHRVLRLEKDKVSFVTGVLGGGYAGDGEMASKARLLSPSGVAVYGADVLIADTNNNRVRIVRENGMIETFAT